MKAKEYAEQMKKLSEECRFVGLACVADNGSLKILPSNLDPDTAIRLAKWILETFE